MKNNALRRALAVLLICLMLIPAFMPTMGAAADERTIHISTADELLELAESCTLDTWSQDKRVVLDNDISLEGVDFTPIPTFGGSFAGKGHTISGLTIDQSWSPVGLFCILQENGSIKDLNVEGSLVPGGDSESTGGIVGENNGKISGCRFTGTISGIRSTGGIAGTNTITGVISGCTAGGAMFGENMTGGIAGYNLGRISDCTNSMFVNIESTDPGIDLSRVDLDFSLDLATLSRLDTANISTDTGGIAGYSSGTITGSRNLASIGHQHIGYNVGGIAGRSCGEIRGCSNEGGICGRKDVGGIIGQMEPYISMQLSESTLDKIQSQLQELNDLVNKAADDAEGGSAGISSRLNNIAGGIGNAANAANSIRVTAGIDTTVTGEGEGSSQTQVGAGGSVDAGAGQGAGGSLSVDHDSGSLSIDVSAGQGGGIGIDSSVGADGEHSGSVSGSLSASTTIVATPELGGLTSAISGISGQLAMLNNAISGTMGTLADDVREINSKFNELSTTIFDAINTMEAGDIITDMSQVDVELITLGKTSRSTNSGTVYGDINSGGIVGSMAIEYELDPEDDTANDLSGNYRREYEYRAVIQSCVNTGAITSKRSYAGGICGRMDLGLITGSEGYGSIESESGNYVGGITGVTAATVRSCFAKCTLSGNKYVGGITGSGVSEMATGDGSTVAGCYSMVDIASCQQYGGAISGGDAGSFLENCYVSDTLAGINRQSYSGEAEPVTFKALQSVSGLPDAMRRLTLTFVADGETVYSAQLSYGASFDETQFPELPQKDGYIAEWDKTQLQELHFDTVVTAVYTPYIPALASSSVREDGRAIILAEGSYTDTDAITISSEPLTPGAFNVRSGSLANRLESYFDTMSDGEFSLIKMNWEVVEQWSVQIPSDGQTAHKLRYLAPGGETHRLRIYVENNGVWDEVEYDTMGSYLVFPVSGSNASIAMISTMPIWWVWALAVLVLAGIALLVILLIRRLIKRTKNRVKSDAPAAEPQPAAVQDAAERAEMPGPDRELLARAESAEARLAAAEEELRRLRQGSAVATLERPDEPGTPGGSGDSDDTAAVGDPKPPKKRKKRWWMLILALVLLATALVSLYLLHPSLKNDLETYYMLKTYSEKDPLQMTLDLTASVGGETVSADAQIYRTKRDGSTITCIQRDGVSLYYSGSTVYLENGKAYSLGGAYPDYSQLLGTATELYRLIDVTTASSGSKKTYTIAAEGDNAAQLLDILLPDMSAVTADIRTLNVQLTSDGGKLTQLRFFTDTDTELSLSALLLLDDGSRPAPDIPDTVLEAIASGGSGGSDITADLYRLLQAWAGLYSKEYYSADIALSADCGPIVVNDTVQYDQQKVSGQSIGCIRKNSLTVYFSGDKLCDESGHSISADSQSLVDSAKLVELAYRLILGGTISCAQTGDTYVYSLDLDEQGMADVAYAIAPDVKSQSLTFTSGRLEVTVTGEEITSIGVSCSGSIHVVVTDTAVSLGSSISFTDREVSMPQQVIAALKK